MIDLAGDYRHEGLDLNLLCPVCGHAYYNHIGKHMSSYMSGCIGKGTVLPICGCSYTAEEDELSLHPEPVDDV